jgi:hypothetical protein
LPTSYFTLLAKFYNGEDLRSYFAGQLYSNYNDTFGLTGVTTAASIDGSSTVAFGLRNGNPVVAAQRPVRTAGGFLDLGFPLSRIFHANPRGRNAGWSLYLHQGIDDAFARDARRIAGGRGKSTWSGANVQYKLNSFTTFLFEESYYRTRTANNSASDFGGLPLLRGIPSRQWQDWHSELALMFSF